MAAVYQKVKDIPAICAYLPDCKPEQLRKDWFFAVVNTSDPAFFPAAIEELEARALGTLADRAEAGATNQVHVDPAIFELLSTVSTYMLKGKASARSLAGIKFGAKRRVYGVRQPPRPLDAVVRDPTQSSTPARMPHLALSDTMQ